MENIDYTANSAVWLLPWKTGVAAQPAQWQNIPFSEADCLFSDRFD
jgi:hypothetical protein